MSSTNRRTRESRLVTKREISSTRLEVSPRIISRSLFISAADFDEGFLGLTMGSVVPWASDSVVSKVMEGSSGWVGSIEVWT
jgi:hypothetical protein